MSDGAASALSQPPFVIRHLATNYPVLPALEGQKDSHVGVGGAAT